MIPQLGDWLYFPTDTWKGIHKIVAEAKDSQGREGFIVEVHYAEFEREAGRKFVQYEDLDPTKMDGPMLVARTDEEKYLMGLMII